MKSIKWYEDSPVPFMQVVETVYSTLYECCLISPQYMPQEVSFIYSFVQKPLTELEAKITVLLLQTLYSCT
jgi:hypothetical protein